MVWVVGMVERGAGVNEGLEMGVCGVWSMYESGGGMEFGSGHILL